MNQPIPLPVDEILSEVVDGLRWNGDPTTPANLVIEAPPGAGKTTRVPRAILESGVLDGAHNEVWVLEPRRLAARLSARRVAEEMGEQVGQRVGYSVRFEEAVSERTRLRFVTQGVLLRRLLGEGGGSSKPRLDGVGAVVLDEFHERSLEGDVALGLLRRLQQSGARPDLRILAMSATLDAEPVARFLGGCPRVRSEGRMFEVAVEYAAQVDERPLAQQVASAVRKLVQGGLDGDVLVFLPGAGEIRRAEEACAEIAQRADLMVVPLHGEQSPAEQERAIPPPPGRKVILATNVAETSVTIDGVVAVVDGGLARVATHSPWSGLPSLRVQKISRASAAQRAGRAGRTRPGRAVRLYTRHDYDSRAEFEVPEVRRADLADTVLLLRAWGVSPSSFEWFEAPSDLALGSAETVLKRLSAVDDKGQPTAIGRRMLRFPLHPRLARILCEAESRGVASEGARMVAWLGEGRRGGGGGGMSERGFGRGPREAEVSGDSDVLWAIERDDGRGGTVERAQKMLSRMCRKDAPRSANPDQSLLQSLLTGFPDRVARRRRAGSPEVLLSGGGAATLSPMSIVRDHELMVAVDVEEQVRREAGPARSSSPSGVVIKSASAIEADWLLDLFPDSLRETEEVLWDAREKRVRATRRMLYDELVLDESEVRGAQRTPEIDEKMARALAQAAVAAGTRAVFGGDAAEALERFQARLAFAASARPDAGLQPFDDATLTEALTSMCVGRASFAELSDVGLVDALRAQLGGSKLGALDRMAPDRITLPGGRSARIEYEQGKPPHLASRLQDFFGMAEGPRVAGGAIPVTLHLLAPNQRAVQVTTDLAGFWERHYPAIRRELMRKYPRHAWPEDPRHATPPAGGRIR